MNSNFVGDYQLPLSLNYFLLIMNLQLKDIGKKFLEKIVINKYFDSNCLNIKI